MGGMRDRALLLVELSEAIDTLTREHTTTEHVPYWDPQRHRKYREHLVTHPPLLRALLGAIVPSMTGDEPGGRQVPGSRPPLRIEAIDLYERIKAGATDLVPPGEATHTSLTERIRSLSTRAAHLEAHRLSEAVAAVQGWVTQAEVITGARKPLFRPDAPCPVCDRRHGLRVDVDNKRGYCKWCASDWTEETIGVLGAHVARWTEAH